MYVARKVLEESTRTGVVRHAPGDVLERFEAFTYPTQKALLNAGYVERLVDEPEGAADDAVPLQSLDDEQLAREMLGAPDAALRCELCPDKSFPSKRHLGAHRRWAHP